MTLVLSLISESWAIQVSDRRLVYVGPDGTVVRRDDEKNKAILWCNRVAFSYSGLGELGPGGEGTDTWLARELAAWWGEEGIAWVKTKEPSLTRSGNAQRSRSGVWPSRKTSHVRFSVTFSPGSAGHSSTDGAASFPT